MTQSSALPPDGTNTLVLNARFRTESPKDSGRWRSRTKRLVWQGSETAIILCDMWNRHWCQGATVRVDEMAPVMNTVVEEARSRGVLIIHAPSDTLEAYADTPQRARALAAPPADFPPERRTWQRLDPAREASLPIDDSDGGCDDVPQCAQGKAWSSQHPALRIAEEDAISDSGEEVFNLLQQHGIQNVIVMGVHTNMCVLGRSFGIRQMVGLRKRVVLMRDMTDTMYNSRMRPFVNHFRGTDLVVKHIEQYWCPTVQSSDITLNPAFHFVGDIKRRERD